MNRLVDWGREVVAQRIAIVAAITAVLHLAVTLHWVSQGWSDDAVRSVTGGLDLLGTLIAGVVVRRAVTPVKDPRDTNGDPLISLDEHNTTVADALDIAHTPDDIDVNNVPWPSHTTNTPEAQS